MRDDRGLDRADLDRHLTTEPDFTKLPDPPDRDPHEIWVHAFTLLCLALIAFCLFMVARS